MTDPTDPALSAAEAIDIGVPLLAEHAATLRVIIASLGSDNGLSIDEIDDLKLAVSEVFTVLIDHAADSDRALIRYWAEAGAIRIHLTSNVNDHVLELDTLAKAILSSVVDEYTVSSDGIMLVKRNSELTA
jgi:anti-sigma regulatory factor (Ser/Thr protein kinase)